MNPLRAGSIGAFALAGVCLLAACDRGPSSSAAGPANGTAAADSASATPSPMTGITPQPGDAPASAGATGPAEGSTAVGGMVGNQDSGGATKGGPPSPTAGDGAQASAPAK